MLMAFNRMMALQVGRSVVDFERVCCGSTNNEGQVFGLLIWVNGGNIYWGKKNKRSNRFKSQVKVSSMGMLSLKVR